MSSAAGRHSVWTPKRVAVALGGYAVAGGLVTLLGWGFEILRLTDWFGNGISMLPNAGVGALVGGAALICLALGYRRLAIGLGALVCLGAAAIVSQHLTGIDLGIDQLLLDRTWGQNATYVPGRIGVPASVSFTVFGLAIVLASQGLAGRRAATIGGVLVTAIAMLSLIGYLFGVDRLYSLPRLTTIALQTATILLALGAGLTVLANGGAGRARREHSAAARLVRQTLPFLVALPVVLGWLSLRGQAAGLFDPAFGTAMLVLLLIGLLGIVLWKTSASVRSHEESLYQAQERLEGVLASIGDGFQVVDRDWRYTYFNSAMRRTFSEQGLDPDAMLGKTVFEVFPGFGETPGGRALEQAKAQAVEVAYEHSFEPWQKWFAVRAGPTPDGGMSILSQDITERRQVAERLRESEERMQLAMSIADAATWDEDLVNDTLHWSDSYFTLLGHQPTPDRRASRAMWEDAVFPEDRQRIQQERSRAGVDGDTFVSEYRLRNARTGGTIWVSSAGQFFYGANGEPLRFVGVSYEISQRKRQEEELRRLSDDLSETDRNKDEFLATLAHELRNPLAPMRSALGIMALADGDHDTMHRARSTMERQLLQMTRLIDDLLDVSRITRNKLDLRTETVELASVIQHAAEACAPLAELAGIQLAIDLPNETIPLRADPIRLAQIFSNLMNNACKYNDRGGHVWLSAGRQGEELVVSVKDDGIGMASDMLPRVFEMFYQVGAAMQRAQGGLGIGLTLVNRLVEMHGGSITARSPGEGKGSEFIVRLPIIVESALPQSAPPSGDLAPSTPRRVLVVDDNVDAAATLVTLLELLGHVAAMVHDGDAAVEWAATFRPDLIFLDIGLPGRNGYEACRAIRQQPGGSGITIVAVTGWGQEQDRRQSSDAGFDGHLVKPVDINALLKLLDAGPVMGPPTATAGQS